MIKRQKKGTRVGGNFHADMHQPNVYVFIADTFAKQDCMKYAPKAKELMQTIDESREKKNYTRHTRC